MIHIYELFKTIKDCIALKETIPSKFFKRIITILKNEVNMNNIVNAINTYAIYLIKY